MKIPIYQVDAFTDRLFGGNPAAVCPLNEWLEDDLMLRIAAENNLAETAYYMHKSQNIYDLRWYTPEIEMDLCGHATLAAAFVIYHRGCDHDELLFDTKSGWLTVRRVDDSLQLDFPSRVPHKADLPDIIRQGLSTPPVDVYKSRDYLLVYNRADDIRQIQADTAILNQINLDPGGIIVTAPGDTDDIDFVSRFFTPEAAIFEDPVTGSAHCTLTPFWADRLGKTTLKAQQLSARGGDLNCTMQNDRVLISGTAVLYLSGTIEI